MPIWRRLGHARKHLTFIAIFSLGLALGLASVRFYGHRQKAVGEELVETRASGFKFVKPLMECDDADKSELRSFKAEVEEVVRQVVGAGYASRVSVYFRDLNNGPWFSVNPEEDFIPASLLKVPTMIGVLRAAERDPDFLRAKATIPPGFPIDTAMARNNREPMVAGAAYTVEDLLFRMIVYSDNSAAIMLNNLLPKGFEEVTYRELGVGFHEGAGRSEWLSVETYASFFRILFNATYLNREMSERALALLARSDLPPGLPDLAPAGVEVAKKYGHYKLSEAGEADQLHVCGIVYYPQSPYLVCVMTRGSDTANLSAAIGKITSEIFRHVDRQRIGPG